MKLTTIEERVLEMLLRGENEVLSVLREQAKQLWVSSREMTGVGFYANFVLPPGAPCLPGRSTFKLGDVDGAADNITHGIGFLLYVVDGALTMLEGYTYDDPWPDEVQGLVLTYSSKHGRKLDF